MDYAGIIETAQRVQTFFEPYALALAEQQPESTDEWDDGWGDDLLDEEGNPYGGDSVYKLKLVYKGFNPKLKGTTHKGMESDKYWEVKVRNDGSVMRKWGATGKKAHMKVDKKANAKAGIAHAKSMAAKKKAKGYAEVSPKKASSKKVYSSYAK